MMNHRKERALPDQLILGDSPDYRISELAEVPQGGS
jgi:hypothetical protein